MLFYFVTKIIEANFKALLYREGKNLNVCYFFLMCSDSTLIKMIKKVILKYLIKEKSPKYMRNTTLKIILSYPQVSPSKSAYLNCFHIIQTSVDKNISIIIYYLFLLLLRSAVQKLVQVAEF